MPSRPGGLSAHEIWRSLGYWNRAVVRRIAAGQGDAFVKAVQGATAKTEARPRLPGRCSADYEVDVFQQVLAKRFPSNSILSHDLIEGAYARAGLVSDVEVIDDYPSHFRAYSRRKHRWVRGDWQIMRWILPQVPNYEAEIIPNPLNLISRWKIIDNLRRSLFEPATLARLAEVPNIAGVKEASGNISQIAEVCNAVPENFLVFSGDDAVNPSRPSFH